MRKVPSLKRRATPPPQRAETEPVGLSAHGLSAVRRRMDEFDDLPPDVRSALTSSDEPNDQMIGVLCAMNRSGFSAAEMLKVIAASKAKNDAERPGLG